MPVPQLDSSAPSAVPSAVAGKVLSVRELIRAKEMEMQSLNATHFEELETVIQEREKQVTQLRGDFARLQTDFQYNLSLLADRDKELQHLEKQDVNLQKKLAERETKLLALQEHLEQVRIDRDRESGEKEAELKTILQGSESLKRRITELEHLDAKKDLAHKELVEKLRTSAKSHVAQMQQQHEERLQDMQRQLRSEVGMLRQESVAREAISQASLHELQDRAETAARELAHTIAERDALQSESTDLQRRYQSTEQARKHATDLLEKLTVEHDRSGSAFDSERRDLAAKVATLEAEKQQLSSQVVDMQKAQDIRKQQMLQKQRETQEQTVQILQKDAEQQVDAVKSDANRRIQEMERLCREKVDRVRKECEVKILAAREELERREREETERRKELLSEATEEHKLAQARVAEELRLKEQEAASLKDSLDREQRAAGLRWQELESVRATLLEEERKTRALKTEVEALKDAREQDERNHRRDLERLQAELDFQRTMGGSSSSSNAEMKGSFDPLFSGDFGPVMNNKGGQVGGSTGTSKLQQLPAPHQQQQLQHLQVEQSREQLLAVRNENAELQKQLVECRAVIQHMRKAVEARQLNLDGGGGGSAREQELVDMNSTLNLNSIHDQQGVQHKPSSSSSSGSSSSSVVDAARASVDRQKANLFDAHQNLGRSTSSNMGGSEQASPALAHQNLRYPPPTQGSGNATTGAALQRMKEHYDGLLSAKDAEICSLKTRIQELKREGESLRAERSKLMELSNKLKYELQEMATSSAPASGSVFLGGVGQPVDLPPVLTGNDTPNRTSMLQQYQQQSMYLSTSTPNGTTPAGNNSSSTSRPSKHVSFAPAGQVEINAIPANNNEKSVAMETKLYAVEQALRNLEQQNLVLRQELDSTTHNNRQMQKQMLIQDSSGATSGGVASHQQVELDFQHQSQQPQSSSSAAFSSSGVGSRPTSAERPRSAQRLTRAREKVEMAKLELNGKRIEGRKTHEDGRHGHLHDGGAGGGPLPLEVGGEDGLNLSSLIEENAKAVAGGSTSGTTLSTSKVIGINSASSSSSSSKPTGVLSTADKLKHLQKKRQEQRLRSVRNWANVPPEERVEG
ncbi:unnamed protein product [Amoebophrya sp. A25]|nr:unnamed protein product [Amoebophrya sp. A25]|eukprot:GSA25T00017279001.1